MCLVGRGDGLVKMVGAVRKREQIIRESPWIRARRLSGEDPGSYNQCYECHAKRTPLRDAVSTGVAGTKAESERIMHGNRFLESAVCAEYLLWNAGDFSELV